MNVDNELNLIEARGHSYAIARCEGRPPHPTGHPSGGGECSLPERLIQLKRAGAGVVAPVLSDGLASYTPGVSRHTSSGSTFYGTDRQGTDSLQTSATGAVAATKVYDGFGMLVATTGTPVGPFGYNSASGYQEDADTGLMLLGHRYYDSSTGRFITRDPAKDGSNWYDYVGNNPFKYVDPDGLSLETLLGALASLAKELPGLFKPGSTAASGVGYGGGDTLILKTHDKTLPPWIPGNYPHGTSHFDNPTPPFRVIVIPGNPPKTIIILGEGATVGDVTDLPGQVAPKSAPSTGNGTPAGSGVKKK